MKVELRYAPLPLIGAIAVHYWFVVFDDAGACHRWEVWQTKNAGGISYGHVHCDHFEQRAPIDVQFEKNSIRLVFKEEVEVLKFLVL